MTTQARPGVRQLALLPGAERELIGRLYLELMRLLTTQGHRAMANYREGRGECSHQRCAASCREFVGLLSDAADYLLESPEPRAAGAAAGGGRAS